MAAWPTIPQDAKQWLVSVFAEANRRATERLINLPNVRETSLDDGLVEAIVPYSAPRLLPSGAVVEMQVHNIGGLRRLSRWETADIAVLIFVYTNSKLIAQKIGLLQSKRLYPENNDVDAHDSLDFLYGMNKFLKKEPTSAIAKIRANYNFNESCVYGALNNDTTQRNTIDDFNKQFGEAIYYLFYNPPQVPISVQYPVVSYQSIAHPPLGCRVFSAKDVTKIVETSSNAPTLGQFIRSKTDTNWRLEQWIELLLLCKVGQQFDEKKDHLVGQLLERRSGPIGAAIAVSIALPSD